MPFSFAKLGTEIWRLFVTDGVPASGAHEPIKTDIQAWCTTVEDALNDLDISVDQVLQAGLTVWVRSDATGDTLRDGSAQDVDTAFKTWQAAINWVDSNVIDHGFDVTFRQVETGVTFPQTYAPASGTHVILLSKRLRDGGRRIFQFRDALGADDDVRLVGSGAGSAMNLGDDPGIVVIRGKVRVTGGQIGIRNNSAGRILNEGTITFFGNISGPHLQNQQDGSYFSNGTGATIKFDGDCSNCIRNDSGTFHDNGTIVVVGNRTFEAFYRGDFFSQGYLGQNVTQTGTSAGRRVDLRHRSVLIYFADTGFPVEVYNDLPGNTRGDVQPGCSLIDQFWIRQMNIVVGTMTFAASATATVVFVTHLVSDQPNTNYMVEISGGDPARTYVVKPADRGTASFVITADAVNSDTVWWRLEWLPL